MTGADDATTEQQARGAVSAALGRTGPDDTDHLLDVVV